MKSKETDFLSIVCKPYSAIVSKREYKKIKKMLKKSSETELVDYILHIHRMVSFINTAPYKILITATMSAGKSSLVNALIGKEVSEVKNLSCTAKIHSIISKCFDDNFSCKSDEYLSDTESLSEISPYESESVATATYFHGSLGGTRIIIKDTPGINSDMDREHKNITEEEVKNGDYDLIIYVMNVTQFAIDDDSAYLELIKEAIANKNILFVLNKVDCLNPERENLYDFIKKAQSYLEKRGFLNPIICPLSAKVGISSKCVPRGDIDYIDYLAMT
ncbi:MAG: dynamin family protein, partial [Selenomonadaceae bacterium]|nr:dynamin family protein [Selenomonadaceae bacterium]